MAVRERLDRRNALDQRYVTMQPFIFNGTDFEKGAPFPIDGLSLHQVLTLHGSRYIDLAPAEPASDGGDSTDRGVTLSHKGGGNYEITAPWLSDPVKARGKDKAEAEAERVRADGPPLGFIEGGSEVTVEQGEGGWFTLTAPWMEAPEKIQGRELAEKRQREIHDAGEPALHHGVSLTDAGNGWFDIKADWEPLTEKVQGEEAARARAAELREAGPPKSDQTDEEGEDDEPLTPGTVVIVGADAGEEFAGLRATIEKIEGENATVVGFAGQDLRKGEVPLASLTRDADQESKPDAGNTATSTDNTAPAGEAGKEQTDA